MNADALILAAGYGKRLLPLTKDKPKPLIEVQGKPLIEWNLEMVKRAGFKRVFVNMFYKKEVLKSFLGDGSRWDLEIVCVEEEELLDTGGAIKNVEEKLVSENLITINSDALFSKNFDLKKFLASHNENKSNPIATMLLKDSKHKKEFGEIGVSKNNQIVSFLGEKYFSEDVTKTFFYTGIQVLSKKVFNYMPEKGSVFSITGDTYKKMLMAKENISSVEYQGYWNDCGTIERLKVAEEEFN